MTSTEAWVVKVILEVIAGIFLIFAAIIRFIETLQNENIEPVKEWFEDKWNTLNKSTWVKLPEIVIFGTLNVKNKLFYYIHQIFPPGVRLIFLFILTLVASFIGSYLYWNIWIALIPLYILACLIPINIIYEISGRPLLLYKLMSSQLYLAFGVASFLGVIAWILYSLNLSLGHSVILFCIISPLYAFNFIISFAMIWSIYREVINDFDTINNEDALLSFSLGTSLSFLVTYFSFFIGHHAVPTSPVPQTLQMLISNFIFDGWTIFITIKLLRWSISKTPMLRIPIAIILDLIFAAFLSILSLYLGLFNSSHTLSIDQVFNILIAKSINGELFEIGPYFWVMHTTFIPTTLYFGLIFISWIAKVILTPVKWFFGKGYENRNPLKMTAALFTVVAVLFGFFSYCAHTYEEILKIY